MVLHDSFHSGSTVFQMQSNVLQINLILLHVHLSICFHPGSSQQAAKRKATRKLKDDIPVLPRPCCRWNLPAVSRLLQYRAWPPLHITCVRASKSLLQLISEKGKADQRSALFTISIIKVIL